MLNEICKELNNWFDIKRIIGDFTIENGIIIDNTVTDSLQDGQYFRIVGSVFNDGVYDNNSALKDEHFHGAVWLMAVPPEMVSLAKDISEWQAKYGGVDSTSMSPYSSESFGGYSYTKSSGSTPSGSGEGSWQGVFANRLKLYRKVHPY